MDSTRNNSNKNNQRILKQQQQHHQKLETLTLSDEADKFHRGYKYRRKLLDMEELRVASTKPATNFLDNVVCMVKVNLIAFMPSKWNERTQDSHIRIKFFTQRSAESWTEYQRIGINYDLTENIEYSKDFSRITATINIPVLQEFIDNKLQLVYYYYDEYSQDGSVLERLEESVLREQKIRFIDFDLIKKLNPFYNHLFTTKEDIIESEGIAFSQRHQQLIKKEFNIQNRTLNVDEIEVDDQQPITIDDSSQFEYFVYFDRQFNLDTRLIEIHFEFLIGTELNTIIYEQDNLLNNQFEIILQNILICYQSLCFDSIEYKQIFNNLIRSYLQNIDKKDIKDLKVLALIYLVFEFKIDVGMDINEWCYKLFHNSITNNLFANDELKTMFRYRPK
jgi:hypothetical protein